MTNTEKEKFQMMLELADFGAKRMEERRSIEFKIFISYMTLLVLALYQLIKKHSFNVGSLISLPFKQETSTLIVVAVCVVGFLIHVIYIMWQVGMGVAMENDTQRRNYYLDWAESISGKKPKYSSKNKISNPVGIVVIDKYHMQFCYLKVIWTDWSRLLLVAIPTLLLLIVTDIYQNSSDINVYQCFLGICS